MRAVFILFVLVIMGGSVAAQPAWRADLDSDVLFYQTTDLGILLAGTEKSLYAIDGRTGGRIWRRSTGRVNETAVTPIPETDLILFSRDLGSKSRLEAVDIFTGERVWQSDKVKGDVLQLAVDPMSDLLAVVLVKDPRGASGSEFKKHPVVHMLRLSDGEELWKKTLGSDVQMMPTEFGEGIGEVSYTLDNYRPPLILDGRLFLFYEGATSFDASTGKEKEREKFSINQGGLALTEADPIFDDTHVYISGRGKIRAVNRRTGKVDWKADDLGICAEMAIIGKTLFVRTGGQFTRLKDGEIVSKGPYGVSAIDTETGKTLWRYKGADKGLTNFAFPDAGTILIADRDDLISLDAKSGKSTDKFEHDIDNAQFVILNESGNAVVGGRDEIAAFEVGARTASAGFVNASFIKKGNELWRVRHKAPARGVFRIVAGIALRATALYFRYGGFATSAIGLARGGLNIANTVNSFRWSGLRSRFGSFDLTTLAANSAQNYVTRRLYSFGSLSGRANMLSRIAGFEVITPSQLRSNISGAAAGRITRNADVSESIFDRLDPARQLERFSDHLLRKNRLAELRGSHMYFFTDLGEPFDKKGLVGVNVHNGRDSRFILISEPDEHFITDEVAGVLYSADGDDLEAYDILTR